MTDCRCEIRYRNKANEDYTALAAIPYIDPCPLHNAAGQMLEALEQIEKHESVFTPDPYVQAMDTIREMRRIARAALAAAKPEGE